MTTRIALIGLALALSANAALAFDPPRPRPNPLPVPTTPIPGEPICNPEINPDCGEVVITNPGDGGIYPDPTFTILQCERFWSPADLFEAPLAVGTFNPDNASEVGVYVQSGWDHDNMYYTQVLTNADPGGQLDFGTTMADLDGDGALDLVVGMPHSSKAASDGGALAIFFGPVLERTLDMERPDLVIAGAVRGGELGLGVGRLAGKAGGPDGLRVNSPFEGLIYVIPASGELPGILDERHLVPAE